MTAMKTDQDQNFMQAALEEAQKAFEEDEVPVGAVVVAGDRVVGRGRNHKEATNDPTAHAEMAAIRQAAEQLARWRLTDCTLYVTLEPCPMCLGAMLSARIARLVFGCADPKAGAAGTLYNLADDSRLNHKIVVEAGVLERQAAELLKTFFKNRRS